MFLGLTSLVRLLSGLDLHWHVGLFLAWLLQHLLLLTSVQGQFSTTGIWWNFSAQKFNNLVYACMHAPSCIWKRKILRSHVTCKIQSKTVETQEHIIKKHNTWLDELYKREKIRLIVVMTYLLVWPAVFAIPSCFHCCLSADFISYPNCFCFAL